MKRFLMFTVLFPPLALLVYTSPLVIQEGVPKLGFIIYLMEFAYVLAVVPCWLAAATDWMLSARPSYVRMTASMAVAAVMAHLVARYLGDSMDVSEIVTVALTGAVPAAVCSWLSGQPLGEVIRGRAMV
jgi:hypothetical protein